MKDEPGVTETDRSKVESKTKKYIRNAFGGIMMAVILLTCVMAVLRRCGM